MLKGKAALFLFLFAHNNLEVFYFAPGRRHNEGESPAAKIFSRDPKIDIFGYECIIIKVNNNIKVFRTCFCVRKS